MGAELLTSDNDGDGVADCNDLCPMDSLKSDPGILWLWCGRYRYADGDGTPDCIDLCPSDSLKIDPGICGCSTSDVDTDGDGEPDCIDVCPDDFDPAQEDADGDGFGDVCDNCPTVSNSDQADVDADGTGDVCDYDNDILQVIDADSNILIEVNDEGLVGSITLRDTTSAPGVTTDKLYGVNGMLHYNGSILAPADSAGGWTHDSSVVRLGVLSDRVGIGTTNPQSKLSINGEGFANAALYAEQPDSNGRAVYGITTHTQSAGIAGYFKSAGNTGRAVQGWADDTTGANMGGAFFADGINGWAVYGLAGNPNGTNYGGVFYAQGVTGRAVFGSAQGTSGENYGGYFVSNGETGRAVYGQGFLIKRS